MEYIFHIVVLVSIFAMLATSLNLLVGETGLLSFAHAGFYAIGAYSSAILSTRFGVAPYVALPMSVGLAALLSLFISLPSLRLREDHFVLTTFGFPIVLTGVLNNWTRVTGGSDGICSIPVPSLFGLETRTSGEFAVIALSISVCSHLLVLRVSNSPFGRVLRAIREDEHVVEACGKNPAYFKIAVFAVSAAVAAAAGSIYAHYVGFIDPSGFSILESVLILSMVIIGGPGSKWGPIAGALLLVTFPEALRFLSLPSAVAADFRQILYGMLLVLIMVFRPQGLLGPQGVRY